MKRKKVRVSLYNAGGTPCENFNANVRQWLAHELPISEHKAPAAFDTLRGRYDKAFDRLRPRHGPAAAHKLLLSNLTRMMFGVDLGKELAARLSAERISPGGFRTALAQAQAKNAGENFVNAIVYALARLLEHQDEVLVDKGIPARLQQALKLTRTLEMKGETRTIEIPIEGDLCIFSRQDVLDAIVINSKTRLKEVFHIGTMWALFFRMLEDPHCHRKWTLSRASNDPLGRVVYAFATADMVPPGGRKTQGPDVERKDVRNLIAMDASFFDYVFVSKTNISHVATSLTLGGQREGLFHELGCLIDLMAQKFPKAKIRR